MYKILCRYADSDKFEDTFCDNSDIIHARYFANRWKQGAYTGDPNAVAEAIVVDSAGNIVYRTTGKDM